MHTDEELIAKYLKGDEEALRALIERYLKPIYNFVYTYTGEPAHSEEITQDVFVNVWRNIDRFDPKKKFKTWLFSIAKNTSLNWIKKKKPINFSKFDSEEGENVLLDVTPDPAALPDKVFEISELSRKLNQAMTKISPNYRAVIILHYTEGLTFQEIADSIGESVNTVKSRHRRALMQLKDILVP